MYLSWRHDNDGFHQRHGYDLVVNAAPGIAPPTVGAGKGQAVTIPVGSTTINGTATGNGGATITRVNWKRMSGPATATIGSSIQPEHGGDGDVGSRELYLYINATDDNGKTGERFGDGYGRSGGLKLVTATTVSGV